MEKRIGEVTHYFNQIKVAVLILVEGLTIGDELHIKGRTTDFKQKVESMEVDHHAVETVGPGAFVAIKVNERVRGGDEVYRVDERTGILTGFGFHSNSKLETVYA